MDTGNLLRILLWGLGACITGFLFTVGYLVKMSGDMNKRVTYDWIENNFETKIKSEIDRVVVALMEIKNGLFGDIKNSGIISDLRDCKREIKEIKENCIKRHEE